MNTQSVQIEQQINYHFVKLSSGRQFKVFNQLDNQKHICNFYVHKRDILNYIELSNKVRVGENFIVAPKLACIKKILIDIISGLKFLVLIICFILMITSKQLAMMRWLKQICTNFIV